MKLLAADIGNTNFTLGLFNEDAMVGSWRATTHATATADELAITVSDLMGLEGHVLADLDAVALASVVPPLTESFERFLAERLDLDPLVLDAASLSGMLAIEIDHPDEAGADRLANALAVRDEFGAPAIVVDFGTSTNFDVVSAEGAYLGGAIAPGLGLSLEALVGYASKLPRIELRRPPAAIGSNTVHAMESGMVLGYIGLVNGLLSALRSELAERSPAGSRVTVVATGGYTHEPWLREVEGIDAIEPDLTLRGIQHAWKGLRADADARETTAAAPAR